MHNRCTRRTRSRARAAKGKTRPGFTCFLYLFSRYYIYYIILYFIFIILYFIFIILYFIFIIFIIFSYIFRTGYMENYYHHVD